MKTPPPLLPKPLVFLFASLLAINLQAAPEIVVEQPSGTNLDHSSGLVHYGAVSTGSNAPRTFVVRNTGTTSLSLSGVTTSGSQAGDFVVNTSGMATTLSASQSTTFTVTFTPSAHGLRTASVSIANNDANENPFVARLEGVGVGTSGATPPTISVGTAQNIGSFTAVPRGTVNGRGLSTTMIVELGTSSSYGRTFRVFPTPLTVAGDTLVHALASGLSPATTYHYRVVASNAHGTVAGANQTFTTGTSASVRRWTGNVLGLGLFENLLSWNPTIIPLLTNDALFELNSTYNVGMLTNLAQSLQVTNGNVTFTGFSLVTVSGAPSAVSNASVTATSGINLLELGDMDLVGLTVNNGAFNAQQGEFDSSRGIFIGSGGSLSIQAGQDFDTSGTVVDHGGSLLVRGDLRADSTPHAILAGGTLRGDGSIDGLPVYNYGTVSPGTGAGATAVLHLLGDYVQQPTGTLAIEIGGATQGTQYDAIRNNGGDSAHLSGTLQIQFINGFSPGTGQEFILVDNFNSLSGTFATVTGVPAGFHVVYNETNGSGRPVVKLKATTPEITVEEPLGNGLTDGGSTIDFGSLAAGSANPVRTVLIRNDGSANLTGLSVSIVGAGAGRFQASALGATSLAPGSSTSFTVTLLAASPGTPAATLRIASNDADENPFDIGLAATLAQPPFVLEGPDGQPLVDGASTVGFGTVFLNLPKQVSFQLRNTSGVTFTGLGLSATGAGFSVDPIAATLAPGASVTITLTCLQTTAGPKTGSLQLTCTQLAEAFDVALAANAEAPPPILILDPNGDPLVDGASTVDFGDVVLNTPKVVALELTNVSGAPLTGLGVSATGTGFSVSPIPGSLANGASVTISLTCLQTTTGLKTGQFQLSGDQLGEPFDVALEANAEESPIVIEDPQGNPLIDGVSSVAFGDVVLNTPKTVTLALTNVSGAPLTGLSVAATGTGFSAGAIPSTLGTGGTINIQLTCLQTTTGLKAGQFQLNCAQLNEPFNVSLEANAKEPPPIVVEDPDGNPLIDGVSTVAFGPVYLDVPRVVTLELTNVSGAPLTGLSAGTVGAEFSASSIPATLAPGATVTVDLTCLVTTVGPKTGQFQLNCDQLEEPFDVGLSAQGQESPIVIEDPDGNPLVDGAATVEFGEVIINVPATVTLELKNISDGALTGLDLAVSGTAFSSEDIPETLAPGETASVVLTCLATAPGPVMGGLELTGDQFAEPFNAALEANAVEPPPIVVEDPDGNPLVDGAGTVNFGDVVLNTPKVVSLELTNVSDDPLTGLSVGTTGAEFDVDPIPATLAPGASVTVNLTCLATTVGNKTGTFQLTGDQLDEPFDVALAARADGPPPITLEDPDGNPLIDGVSTLNFGQVLVGGSEVVELELTNVSGGPLTGLVLAVTGSSFSGEPLPSTLAAGATATVSITCAPATAGVKAGQLRILSNQMSQPFGIALAAEAKEPPPIVVEDPDGNPLVDGVSTVSFGTVILNEPESVELELTNVSGAPLTGLSIAVSGDAAFSVSSLPATLAVGASVTVTVECLATTTGAKTGQIQMDGDQFSETFDIALAANAKAPPPIVIEDPDGNPLVDGESTVAFGDVVVNESKTVTLELTNISDDPLTGLALDVVGADFSGGSLPSTLAAGATASIELTCEPTTLGAKSGSFQVSCDQMSGPFEIALSATAVAPPPIIVRGPDGEPLEDDDVLDFGDVAPGEPKGMNLQLTNNGATPITGLGLSVSGESFSGAAIPATLAPGATAAISLTCLTSTQGLKSGQLQLTCDQLAEPFDLGLIANADHRASKPVIDPVTLAPDPTASNIVWNDAAAGLYDGLLRDNTDGTTLVGGGAGWKVSRPKLGSGVGGAVSGVLFVNGRKVTVKGRFAADGTLNAVVNQKRQLPVVVSLRLMRTNTSPEGYKLRGTVQTAGTTAVADLLHAPFNKKFNPAPASMTGLYTHIMPSEHGWGDDEPGGDGWASGSVSTAGALVLRGALGDGSKYTEVAYLSVKGEASLYTELYRSRPMKGRFGGRILIRDVPGVSDYDGLMQWRKFPDAKERRYAAGFARELWALGSRFVRQPKGQRLLTQLLNQHYNAEVSFIGPTAPSSTTGDLDRVLSWLGNDRILHYGPQRLSAVGKPANGTLAGSFFDPANRVKVPYSGVVFQKQGLAVGVFLNGASSGAVRIQPGTNWVYPGSEDAGALTRLDEPGAGAGGPVESSAAFNPIAAGVYGGVLFSGGQTTGGLENVKLTAAGAVTGAVWIEGVRHAFRGVLLADGSLAVPVAGSTMNLQLSLIDGSGNGYGFTGSLILNATTHAINAQRRPAFSKSVPAPQAGAYTLAMAAPSGVDPALQPGGDGYGAMRVSQAGQCSGVVVLADGSRASLAGHVGRAYDNGGVNVAEWSFHRGLYGKIPRGYLAGILTFRDVPGVSDVDGQWRWVRQAGTAPAAAYFSGFDTSRAVVGSRYVAPAKGQRAMPGLANDYHNLWLRFVGPDMSILGSNPVLEMDRVATWMPSNKIIVYRPEKVSISFNVKNGLIAGRCLDRERGINNMAFGGALLQKQGLVSGCYFSLGRSGLFSIEPR